MPESPHQTDRSRRDGSACGYHLLGFITSGFGLGESARHTLRRMQQLDIPMTIRDVDTGDHRTGQIHEFDELLDKRRKHWPGRINLIHLNPPEFESMVLSQYPELPLLRNLNVIAPFWELPVLPENWLPLLHAVDCVLAPTRFIQEIISRHFPEKPIIHYPQKVEFSDAAEPDRSRFGLPEDAFVFLCGLDSMSDMERKNPQASIEAFKKAFPGDEKVRLFIKLSNPEFDGVGERIKQAVAGDERIIISTEVLTREQLQQLYASCNALTSLHRSEGLGLFIMEMMAQAKPTIVTAWSGNMDFTTSKNSCLVDFRMVPVKSNHPAYAFSAQHEDAQWAEADTDCAAGWMKKLAGDPALCKQLGEEGRKTMIELAEDDCTEVFEQLEALLRRRLKRNAAARTYLKKHKRRHLSRKVEGFVKRLVRGTDWQKRKSKT